MNIRKLALTAVCASVAIGIAAPAFADDDWRGHERREWREHAWRNQERREHQWREHEWREHAWRERQWRENYYAPPVVVAPGYYASPRMYYGYPGYYR